MRTDLINCFKDIMYYDKEHIYINQITGEKLKSVTSLIKNYESEFKQNEIADYVAKRDGKTKKEILKEWNLAKIIGSEQGKIIHNYIENLWDNKIFEDNISKEASKLKIDSDQTFINKLEINKIAASNFVNKIKEFIVPVKTEMIVGDELLAGQVDFFGFDTRTNKFIIFDWKTNKKYRTSSSYSYKDPIGFLPQCESTKFYLQVYIYKYLIEKCNPEINIDIPYIVWFNGKDELPILFQAPIVYQDYAKLIIEDYKNNLK